VTVHREANASLIGQKILVVCDEVTKGPWLYATKGRHNAQYMVVEGESKPAYAMIDVKLRYVKER